MANQPLDHDFESMTPPESSLHSIKAWEIAGVVSVTAGALLHQARQIMEAMEDYDEVYDFLQGNGYTKNQKR